MVLATPTEVLGTVRYLDQSNQEIDGLVIRQRATNGGWVIMPKPDAIQAATNNLLWCRTPGDGHSVWITPVDQDGDLRADYVRTDPDDSQSNNLLALPMYDRAQQIWLDPQTGRQLSPPQ